MSSRRVVISGAALATILVAGGWYAGDAFPVEQAASPFAPTPAPNPPVQAPGPAERVNPITPENPIPRRLSATPILYPVSLAGTGFSAVVEARVVLDAGGSIASVGRGAVALLQARSASNEDARRAMDAFGDVVGEAVRQWRYEAPAQAPIAFFVTATFTPGGEVRVVQSETTRGVTARGLGAGVVIGGGGAGLRAAPQDNVAAAAPADGGPVRVGSGVPAPIQLRKVNPVYPPIAQ